MVSQWSQVRKGIGPVSIKQAYLPGALRHSCGWAEVVCNWSLSNHVFLLAQPGNVGVLVTLGPSLPWHAIAQYILLFLTLRELPKSFSFITEPVLAQTSIYSRLEEYLASLLAGIPAISHYFINSFNTYSITRTFLVSIELAP